MAAFRPLPVHELRRAPNGLGAFATKGKRRQNLKRHFSLDIDDVVADFTRHFFVKNGRSKLQSDKDYRRPRDYWYSWLLPQTEATPEASFDKVFDAVKHNPDFWLTVPVLDSHIPVEVEFYLTSRECPNEVTQEWLRINDLPQLEVVNATLLKQKKWDIALERGITGHIDDKDSTFIGCIEHGLKDSYLVSRPWNTDTISSRRIYRLEEVDWRS